MSEVLLGLASPRLSTTGLDRQTAPPPSPIEARSRLGTFVAWAMVVLLCLLHGLAIWVGMGGLAGLSNSWPLALHDHPLYFHSAVVTRSFLRISGTTAGYDPSLMSGYAKSVVWPSSSTLPELVMFAFGGTRPVLAYKLYVFISAALVPWIVACAGAVWRARPGAIWVALILFLIYLWTDFPINYAAFGMLPYLLAIPIGLLSTALLTRYLERGGFWWWLASALGASAAVLVHFTTALIVVPAALLSYVVATRKALLACDPFSASRHLGVWCIPVVVLALNAFWWLPGLWLASTKGPSDFAFAHPEGVLSRLWQIVTTEAPIESVLWALGILGMASLLPRDRVAGAALGGFLLAGFAWGYLAGALRVLDFLQPGRHTYAFYSAAALAGGLGIAEVFARLRATACRLTFWAAIAVGLVGLRLFGPSLFYSVQNRVGGAEPFLSSRPSPRLQWVVNQVRKHVRPGERLLYEEGGKDLPGIPDPFRGGRYSGLLPFLTGVEVIGSYLHASLTTNFTQFGEGKLFGKERWDRDHFVRYARLYRPSAIVCWTPYARAFCRANPDLIEVRDVLDLGGEGSLLIGRVVGFEGATSEGTARVEAEPGRLRVSGASAELDGIIVLRYHFVPCLRSSPPVRVEPVYREGDPVPFIGLRPTSAALTLELDVPP